ncbi:MAG: hypothetical protein LUG46_06140 [Erysipelotrichaceae bacterium]|nr:hypothetical protein [Erysipelotrichaceae bacterium]
MGVNYFTKDQVEKFKKNPHVKYVSECSISFTEEFKEEFWIRYSNGELPGQILLSIEIDPKVLGRRRMSNIVQRIKKEANRIDTFKDKRHDNKGRPSIKTTDEMTPEQELEYLRNKVEYLMQENEFLKKIEFAEKKAQWQHQQRNLKSSKK